MFSTRLRRMHLFESFISPKDNHYMQASFENMQIELTNAHYINFSDEFLQPHNV